MIKQSTSVYNPKNPLERSIQSSYHKYKGLFLTSYECKLAAAAITSLKRDGEWIHEEELYDIRADHILSPEMEGDGEEVVFATYLLFFRDIFENKKISSQLHDPIVFVSKPIAFYLLREYQLHLIIKLSAVKPSDYIKVGGLYIFEDNVELPISSMVGVKINDDINRKEVERKVRRIIEGSEVALCKEAVTSVGDGVFKLDHGIDLDIRANEKVQNKLTKKMGIVYTTEPGDTGLVTVLYNDGDSETLDKEYFVRNFIYRLGKK